VIVRGGLVDALRSLSYGEGKTAFGENTMMRSPITRWLTAGRFMRGLYGYVKAAAFVFLTGYFGYIQPESAGTWIHRLYSIDAVQWFGWANVYAAVALLVIRGLPVIFDAIPYIKQSDQGSSFGKGNVGDREG